MKKTQTQVVGQIDKEILKERIAWSEQMEELRKNKGKFQNTLKRHIAFAEIALKGGKYEWLLEASKKLHGGARAIRDLGVTSPLLAEAGALKALINKKMDALPTPKVESKFSTMGNALIGKPISTSDGRVRTMIEEDVMDILCLGPTKVTRRFDRKKKGQKGKRNKR